MTTGRMHAASFFIPNQWRRRFYSRSSANVFFWRQSGIANVYFEHPSLELIYVIRIAQVNAIELGNLPGLLYSSRLIAPVVLQFKS
jgi:hypothetical protein